jgi:MoxR-like ATPase
MQQTQIDELGVKIQAENQWAKLLIAELHKQIIGQEHLLQRLLIALLADGHILLEGMPGLAKTMAIKSLASACSVDFKRIQFTPDLLPADIVGTMIYNPQSASFQVKKGPVFTNFVLADEINRAPAKVQSALLEAMQERQVTIGDTTYPISEPFLVLATQNPVEQEGTYPLPEAQVDRFLMKVVIDYPSAEEEQLIIRSQISNAVIQIEQMINGDTLLQARKRVREIYMDSRIEAYIVQLVHATRNPQQFNLPKLKPLLAYGAGPRAGIAVAMAAKANAYLNGRAYVVPEDIKSVAVDTMQHRLGLSYEAVAEGKNGQHILQEILHAINII